MGGTHLCGGPGPTVCRSRR